VHFLYNGSIVLLSNGALKLPWAFDGEDYIRAAVVLAGLPIAALGIGSLLLIKRRRLAANADTFDI
jgi:hypothetical protein